MKRFAGLAATLAATLPVSATAQDGSRAVVKLDGQSLVALQIIDPVMGHGVATIFFPTPRTVDGKPGVHFQSRYVVADCDARTIRLGPDTYFNAAGTEIGERALSNSAFAPVQAGTFEADLLDVECLNKQARIVMPPMPDGELLAQYLELVASEGL